MTYELPSNIPVAPSTWHTTSYHTPPHDYHARVHTREDPLATDEFGRKVPKVYKKGHYPFVTASYPSLPRKLKKLTAKVKKRTPPPADAQGRVVIQNKSPKRKLVKSHKKKKRACKSKY